MATDFNIRYNPDVDNEHTVSSKIILALTLQQLKAHIPIIMSITGKSSSGKSSTAINLQRKIFEAQGLSQEQFFNVSNIFTPLEYSRKMHSVLYDKENKGVNCIIIHEARDVIRAKDWHSLLSQVVADVNALSRAIKPLCVIIVSQNVKDITSEVRRTISLYGETKRRATGNVRFYMYKTYQRLIDIETIKTGRRKIIGNIIFPDGTKRKLRPKCFLMNMPPKQIMDMFVELDLAAKKKILDRKLNELSAEMERQYGEEVSKLKTLVDFYTSDPDRFEHIGRMNAGFFVVSKDFAKLHDLSRDEKKEFIMLVEKKMREKGTISNGVEPEQNGIREQTVPE